MAQALGTESIHEQFRSAEGDGGAVILSPSLVILSEAKNLLLRALRINSARDLHFPKRRFSEANGCRQSRTDSLSPLPGLGEKGCLLPTAQHPNALTAARWGPRSHAVGYNLPPLSGAVRGRGFVKSAEMPTAGKALTGAAPPFVTHINRQLGPGTCATT